MFVLRTGEVIQEPIPTVFVRNKMLIFFAIGFVIPLIFACLKPAPFRLISLGLADAFIGIIGFAWPIAFTQYEAMKQMGQLIDAVNYAAFLSILCLFACALLILSIVKYVKVRHELKRPDGRDLLVIIIGIIFYFVTLLESNSGRAK
jgi:hypothetical protein